MPDTDDLRLLTEIVNHGSIGLPQAAWNARMSQPEAAARLVTMAEQGMPLRLVAEGDRQLLWQIAQAGPAAPAPFTPDEAQTGAGQTWGVPGIASWARTDEPSNPQSG